MKKNLRLWLGIGLSVLLCLAFAMIFVTYAQPMKDQRYDLSLTRDISEVSTVSMTQELGWTIFTQEGSERTELAYDGLGGFTSLSHAGQTFYFSRVMTEELDAATLLLGAANRNFSVFLDGELIYTDCPEQDNRIGYLTLPARTWDRAEDVTINLPEDYLGKTLTIAQSTPAVAETPRMATLALPCHVTLCCGYAYESGLIAESFQTALIGVAGYLLGTALVLIFLRRLSRGQADAGLLALALTIFLAMASEMYETSYYMNYFGIPAFISTGLICRQLSVISLLVFLSSRGGRFRWIAWLMTGLSAASLAAFLAFGGAFTLNGTLREFLLWKLPDLLRFASMVTLLVLSAALWRREKRFYKRFLPLSAILLAGYLLLQLLLPSRAAFFGALAQALRSFAASYLTTLLVPPMMAASLLLCAAEFLREEIDRYAEKRLMLERGEMVQQRYDNLRRHNEEVMMLRHDMKRHYRILRQMVTDDKSAEYLDELIGQTENIRPVIQTGNEMLDIILCGRLSAAMDAGVTSDILRAHAPEKLPLSDADLCSLVMNLMDNAVAAARSSGAEKPFIRLDLHVKNEFFVLICENSADMTDSAEDATEKTVPEHGLGLRIVRQIADKNGILTQTEYGADFYKVSLAIPLCHSAR